MAILKKVNQWLQLISCNSLLLYCLESNANINYYYSRLLLSQLTIVKKINDKYYFFIDSFNADEKLSTTAALFPSGT